MIAKNNFEKKTKEHLKIKVIVIDIKILNVILERILKKNKEIVEKLEDWSRGITQKFFSTEKQDKIYKRDIKHAWSIKSKF